MYAQQSKLQATAQTADRMNFICVSNIFGVETPYVTHYVLLHTLHFSLVDKIIILGFLMEVMLTC